MTPKEKAKCLIDRFIANGCFFDNAKKCAMIAAEEVYYCDAIFHANTPETLAEHKYWADVIGEIESPAN